MHELIVGSAGSGKTTELERRYKMSRGALFLSRNGTTPYKLATDIVTEVEGLVPEPKRASAEGEKRSRFTSKKEYEERLTLGAPISLCGEVMKSFGECEIANFLFESKIDYIYEHPYKLDTRTEKYSQYRPDFYLPEYGIYIEYFALDRNGKAPMHFADGAAYERGVEWKKALHEREGTLLIDLYSYQRADGELTRELAVRLKKSRVKLRRRRCGELYPKDAAAPEHVGDDFTAIIKRATDYVRAGEYSCPWPKIFVDDIDLFEDSIVGLLFSLSVPIVATARSEVIEANVTRLQSKYRSPDCRFAFSHTDYGERDEVTDHLTSLPDGARVCIIAKKCADAAILISPYMSLSYNREGECVHVRFLQRPDLRIFFVGASRVEGCECEYVIVLADTFGDDDEREFETAVTRAKSSVLIISKTGAENPMARELREKMGVSAPKRGFRCPECGSPLSVVKGRYGDFLGCRRCGYKRRM